jgi:hypothetical protein
MFRLKLKHYSAITQAKNLKLHEASAPGSSAQNGTIIRVRILNTKTTFFYRYLKIHLHKSHHTTNEKNVYCGTCHKVYKSQTTVYNHYVLKHGKIQDIA